MSLQPFIVFEGLDGSGKTTQIKLLSKWLTKKGYKNIRIREPGSTKLGEKIRKLLKTENMNSICELLLFNTAREALLTQVLQKKDHSHWILCDRYKQSTWAYQHYGRNLDAQLLLTLDNIHTYNREPDIVIFLPQYAHIEARDTFEQIDTKKILHGYQSIMDEKWIVVPILDKRETLQFIINKLTEKLIEKSYAS